eukprot:CFRG8404T1
MMDEHVSDEEADFGADSVPKPAVPKSMTANSTGRMRNSAGYPRADVPGGSRPSAAVDATSPTGSRVAMPASSTLNKPSEGKVSSTVGANAQQRSRTMNPNIQQRSTTNPGVPQRETTNPTVQQQPTTNWSAQQRPTVNPNIQQRPKAKYPNEQPRNTNAGGTSGTGAERGTRSEVRTTSSSQPLRHSSPNKQPAQPSTGNTNMSDKAKNNEPDLVSSMWGMWSSASKAVEDAARHALENETVQVAYKNINEGVTKGLQVANESIEKVKTAFDPYNGLDLQELSVLVASMNPKYLIAVQEALSIVMPLSNISINGVDVDVGVARQVVGFSCGQAAAENLLVGLRLQSGANSTQQNGVIVISIQNFITQIGANWYDMACVILQDDNRDISLVTFSQGVRVPMQYVEEARRGVATYEHRNTGFEITIGEAVHQKLPKVPSDDWHGHFSNGHMNTAKLIENAVIGVLGEYLVELRSRECQELES